MVEDIFMTVMTMSQVVCTPRTDPLWLVVVWGAAVRIIPVTTIALEVLEM
jgi:hypothetical protein